MKLERVYQISWHLAALAVLIAALNAGVTLARADTVLFEDNFSAPAVTLSMNDYITSGRQSGTLGFQTYTGYLMNPLDGNLENLFNGDINRGYIQLGNSALPAGDGTLAMTGNWSYFPWPMAVVNQNFNGALAQGGLKVSIDVKNEGPYWGAIVIGADPGVKGSVWDDSGPGGAQGIRFALKIASDAATGYDTGTALASEAFTSPLASDWHHFDLLCTDLTDGNPFDGVGQTQIDVYLDGATTPFYTYTKTGGGYANNYIGLTTLTHDGYGETAYTLGDNKYFYFDNLTVAQVPEPGTLTLLALMGLGLAWYRLRK